MGRIPRKRKFPRIQTKKNIMKILAVTCFLLVAAVLGTNAEVDAPLTPIEKLRRRLMKRRGPPGTPDFKQRGYGAQAGSAALESSSAKSGTKSTFTSSGGAPKKKPRQGYHFDAAGKEVKNK